MWNITLIYKKGGLDDPRNFTYHSITKPTHEELIEAIKINSALYALVEQVKVTSKPITGTVQIQGSKSFLG